MEIWQIIVVPLLTTIFVVMTRPVEILVARRRTGSVNSIRIIAEFMIRALGKIDEGQPLHKEIKEWLRYPNSLGSEASLGVLLAKICVTTNPTKVEIRHIDIALNALDQRATERERAKASAGISDND